MSRKYLVFVCTEVGLGHLLSALLHSAYYAYKTDRVLAIDMRRFIYFRNNRHAEFFHHFGLNFPANLEIETDLSYIDTMAGGPGARMIVQGDYLDIDKPYNDDVVIVPCYCPGEPYTVERGLNDAAFKIRLKGTLIDRWEEAKQRAEWSGTAVGIHYRAMTGEFFERMNRNVIQDFDSRADAIREKYLASAQQLADQIGLQDPEFFLASDDASFIEYMRGKLKHVVTSGARIPTRPNQSWSELIFENNFDINILSDAVIDLWFLSECDGIVRSPYSAYSGFAILNGLRVIKSQIVDVPIPNCADIFTSLEPEVAVNWTRIALREAQARRIRETYPYKWYSDALERSGRNIEAEKIKSLAHWQWEAVHSTAANMPGEQLDLSELTGDKLKTAIKIFRRMAARLPSNPYVLSGFPPRSLAHLLAESGEFDEAIILARRAMMMNEEDAYLHWHLGELLIKAGRFEDAEVSLRRSVGLAPDDGTLFGDYARCLRKLGRPVEAMRMLRVAVALNPERLRWRLELARLLVRAGDTDGAKSTVLDGMSPDVRRAEVLHALSFVLENAGQLVEASDVILQACELEPHVLQWRYRRGELCIATGNMDEAEKAFLAILGVDPDSAHANHAMSILFQRKGLIDEALFYALRALEIEPYAAHRNARVGELFVAKDDFVGAVVMLEKAIAICDSSADTRFILSTAFEKLGELPQALIASERALEIEPEDHRWRDRVGDLIRRMGRADIVETERLL